MQLNSFGSRGTAHTGVLSAYPVNSPDPDCTGRKLCAASAGALTTTVPAIIAAAKETGTWLEVNGGPERLDLPDIWVRKAIEAGVYLVTNSDAHAVEELDWMEYAVANARRGWCTKSSIANALPLDAMLAARKARPA
jgi:histidinol phosphatase-like PHP family hydrolase